jgi:hypothetical protein
LLITTPTLDNIVGPDPDVCGMPIASAVGNGIPPTCPEALTNPVSWSRTDPPHENASAAAVTAMRDISGR